MLDVIVAVILALLAGFSAYLGVHLTIHGASTPADAKRYKAAFIAIGIASAALIGLQAFRGYTASERLTAQLKDEGVDIKQIKENTKQPPVVNVSPVTSSPVESAFVKLEKAELNPFQSGARLEVNVYCQNVGPNVSHETVCVSQLFTPDTVPIGVDNAPLLTASTEDKLYEKFIEAVRQAHLSGIGVALAPSEHQFQTMYGPSLDQTNFDLLSKGSRAIFLASQFSWKDGSGRHVHESCRWVQPGQDLNKRPLVWHFCLNHNQ